MFFYLHYNSVDFSSLKIATIKEEHAVTTFDSNTLYVHTGAQRIEMQEFSEGNLLLLGDPVFKNRKQLKGLKVINNKIEEKALYDIVRGHYYWFFIKEREIQCGTSFGSIFPIYYIIQIENTFISSSSFFLAEQTGAAPHDQRNLLERLLFNYPFFDSTWWRSIKLLDTHRHLIINHNKIEIKGSFEISDYFGDGQDHSTTNLEKIADVFQEETELYFPQNEPFGISLTGGFDGRTLVAAARKAGHHFTVFCYGRSESSDLVYSQYLAKKLKIPHLAVRLDEDYVATTSQSSAQAFMHLTEYNGNFGRPHYDYAARLLAKNFNYILTGNFGSELFRALHSNGPVMSACLTQLFSQEKQSWQDHLQKVTHTWHPTFFNQELDALIADLESYLAKLQHLPPNQQFYYFVYNELFRKYFGAEIVMQSHYLNNRTPYLNLRLTEALNQTIWSGVHSAIFEKNLLKRRKGQIFYATFLRQSDPLLYHLRTNKGYRPADLLESWRAPFLVAGGIYQKYLKKPEQDAHAVEAFFRENHAQIATPILENGALPFIKAQLQQSFQEIPQGTALKKWIQFYSIAAGWEAATTKYSYNTL